MTNTELVFEPATTKFQWKFFSYLPHALDVSKLPVSVNDTPAVGMYRQFGAEPARSFVPYSLTPTNVLHQGLLRDIARFRTTSSSARLPAEVRIIPGVIGRMNVTLHAYLPRVLCITISLDNLVSSEALEPRTLLTILERRGDSPVSAIAEAVLASVDQTATVSNIYPALSLELPDSAFLETISQNRARLISILIRRIHHKTIAPELIEEQWAKSEPLNRKNLKERLFVNKQSLLYLRSNDLGGDEPTYRLDRLSSLAEIALVWSLLFDHETDFTGETPESKQKLLTDARYWIRVPAPQLYKSVSYRLVFEQLINNLFLLDRYATFLEFVAPT